MKKRLKVKSDALFYPQNRAKVLKYENVDVLFAIPMFLDKVQIVKCGEKLPEVKSIPNHYFWAVGTDREAIKSIINNRTDNIFNNLIDPKVEKSGEHIDQDYEYLQSRSKMNSSAWICSVIGGVPRMFDVIKEQYLFGVVVSIGKAILVKCHETLPEISTFNEEWIVGTDREAIKFSLNKTIDFCVQHIEFTGNYSSNN